MLSNEICIIGRCCTTRIISLFIRLGFYPLFSMADPYWPSFAIRKHNFMLISHRRHGQDKAVLSCPLSVV